MTSYCSEIFMPFGSLKQCRFFSPLSVLEKKKKERKQNQDRVIRRFYGVEKKPKAPQRALGCPMMVSPAPRALSTCVA